MKKYALLFILFFLNGLHLSAQNLCSEGKILAFKNAQSKKRADAFSKRLMEKYDVHFYYLDIHAERQTTIIDGNVTIGATILTPTDTFCFELNKNLFIDSIWCNNKTVSFARNEHITYAILDSMYSTGNQIDIRIFYHGDAHIEGDAAIGSGFTVNNSNVWGDTALYSLSQPNSAYEWFPCKQFLEDKADSAWVFVTTNQENKVGSNGLLVGVDTIEGTNLVKYKWKTYYSICYYLISIAVGQYLDYTFYAHPPSYPSDSIKVVNYIYSTNPNTYTTIKPHLDSVANMLEYFSEKIGLYPFYKEKYGHSMTPFGGGMEHQTMTSTEYTAHFTLLAHELFHQWFGDFVTCKSWKDIYINEGLASYGEYIALEGLKGYDAAQARMIEAHNVALQAIKGSIYVPDTIDVGRIFNGQLTYNKGSAVTHTLRYLLGDSLFFSSLQNFLNEYSFSTAGIKEFKESIEQSSGKDLNDFFNQWYYAEGYPIYFADYYSDEQHIYFVLKQRGSTDKSPIFTTPVEVQFRNPHFDTTITFFPKTQKDTFIISCNEKINEVTIDPKNWILNHTDTIKVNYDLLPLSLPKIDENNTLLFPNPAENEISLYNIKETETTAILIDALGNKLDQFSFQKQIQILTQQLAPGLYFFKISNENQSKNLSFLKK
ncbi:MAG TPA: M1 family aminopeptidase [Chitinophagaceae bacterium]|nr:M1 family aminopeptidase [Chitinophagaceae bacterium]